MLPKREVKNGTREPEKTKTGKRNGKRETKMARPIGAIGVSESEPSANSDWKSASTLIHDLYLVDMRTEA